MFKQAVYNADKTECSEIGYFTNDKNEIQIQEMLPTVKKVPSVLPKEITSLKFAFKDNENESIDGIQYWDTSNVNNMWGLFLGVSNLTKISQCETPQVLLICVLCSMEQKTSTNPLVTETHQM
ncbi:hypothetical protein [Mycoplasma capricolum]|uniref:hypothetical protein n=1 Tax=Mycoplasma capricolum TaxID=2095 RepID=UPI003DA3BB8D